MTKKGDNHFEALVSSLKPHTAYMIRIAAINQIDRSPFTEPVVVKTQEEGDHHFFFHLSPEFHRHLADDISESRFSISKYLDGISNSL